MPPPVAEMVPDSLADLETLRETEPVVLTVGVIEDDIVHVELIDMEYFGDFVRIRDTVLRGDGVSDADTVVEMVDIIDRLCDGDTVKEDIKLALTL